MFFYKLGERLFRQLNQNFRIRSNIRFNLIKGYEPIGRSELFSELDKIPIRSGEIVLIHSAWQRLINSEVKPAELIDFFLNKVGEKGTLVMPAFHMINSDIYRGTQESFSYDFNNRLTSSGLLSSIFLRIPGVIRGKFPYNTLAAMGSKAQEMFMREHLSVKAHDEFSAWHYCMERSAKIIFIGVRSRNTTTMVHVAEDSNRFHWPIEDWWVERLINLNAQNEMSQKSIYIRKPELSSRNLSFSRTKHFKKMKLLTEWEYKGLSLGYIDDSLKLVQTISAEAMNSNLFWWV